MTAPADWGDWVVGDVVRDGSDLDSSETWAYCPDGPGDSVPWLYLGELQADSIRWRSRSELPAVLELLVRGGRWGGGATGAGS